MLAGVLEDGLSGTTMHLTLALSSVRIGDAENAVHHMEHLVKLADAGDLEAGNEILVLAQAGNLTQAEHELIELLEAMGIAVQEGHDSMDTDMDMDSPRAPLQEALEAIEQGDVDTAILDWATL